MTDIALVAENTERGWKLRTYDRDNVVCPEGFTVFFKSKAKAVAAKPLVKYDARNEWFIYDGAV